MVNTEIKVITFFVAKDGEAVYRQQKQDMKLTVARIIKLLIAKFRLKLKKKKKQKKNTRKNNRTTRYDLNPI